MKGASQEGADLRETDYKKVIMARCNLDKALLDQLVNLLGKDLQGADLIGARISSV